MGQNESDSWPEGVGRPHAGMNDCEMLLAGKQAGTAPTVPGWVGPVKPHPDVPAGLVLGPVPMTRERHFGGSWLVLAGHKRTGGSSVFSFVPPGIQLGEPVEHRRLPL